jgi:uncharacterized membrane protein YidH (DUF202 family)
MSEQDILAVVRTLFALERNYLAEERTALSELQAGLALALIGPSATTVLTYVINFTPFSEPYIVELIIYTIFALITIIGIGITYHAYRELRNTRRIIKRIKSKELDYAKKSATFDLLLKDIFSTEEVPEL